MLWLRTGAFCSQQVHATFNPWLHQWQDFCCLKGIQIWINLSGILLNLNLQNENPFSHEEKHYEWATVN